MAAPSACRWHGSPACSTRPPEARAAVTVSPLGLHWAALDEHISVAGLLAGRGDMG